MLDGTSSSELAVGCRTCVEGEVSTRYIAVQYTAGTVFDVVLDCVFFESELSL